MIRQLLCLGIILAAANPALADTTPAPASSMMKSHAMAGAMKGHAMASGSAMKGHAMASGSAMKGHAMASGSAMKGHAMSGGAMKPVPKPT